MTIERARSLGSAPRGRLGMLCMSAALAGACVGGGGGRDDVTDGAGTLGPATDGTSEGTGGSSSGSEGVDSTGLPDTGEVCELQCPEGESCVQDGAGMACSCEPDPAGCPSGTECGPDGHCAGLVWPNDESFANSDPWIPQHHDQITQMRPRVLALNYVNARSMDEMHAQLQDVRDIIAESSRWHGYADPDAPVFLEYELAYEVDLRDPMPPLEWPYRNSTLYPREDPVEGYWGFDYERLFDPDYAQYLGIEDPDQPGTNLALCDAIERGLVHEVWVYGDADVPDVSAAEMLELKPYYDEDGNRLPGAMDRCVGNGCFDEEDVIPCGRSVRVAWFNNTRGPGCFMESLSHAFEGMGRRGSQVLPYLSRYFSDFAGMELDIDYGLGVDSWYSCPYGMPCLSYPDEDSVQYAVNAMVQGTLDGYDPVCGNVHWAPNARQHYDLGGTDPVRTSCTSWRDGSGATELYDGSQHAPYVDYAPDCMGPFLVWWRQNLPGLANTALDDAGLPMRNWWPFLFY
jgi:hypothetical protein